MKGWLRPLWLPAVCAVAALHSSALAQEAARPKTGISQPFSIAGVGDALVTMRFAMWEDLRFLEMVKLIRESDTAFANLEMLFHEFKGAPAAESAGTWMGADPIVADDLKWAGFDLLGLANNHTGDYGEYGTRRTTEVLDHLGLVHAGVGMTLREARRPAYLDTPKGRVALVSCSSSFVPHSRAAHARPDVPGRSGLSRPRLASPQDGRRIIDDLAPMSQKVGTRIEYRDGVGVIDVAARRSSSAQGQ